MIEIAPNISLNEAEIEFTFIRAPGPGGQNVNKVATAVQLRLNVLQSPSIPDDVRARLVKLHGSKITSQGEIIIKASSYRTQERNKQDALDRLVHILRSVATAPKKRKKTKPTLASKQRRVNGKKLRGKIKSLRGKKLE